MKSSLLQGELLLTFNILLGIIIGEILIRLKIADILMKKLLPILQMQKYKIPSVSIFALFLSLASSKTGAAYISSALEKKQISERSAIYSVLMLSLPSYLRRWPRTLTLSLSMAGNAGLFYAFSMLFSAVGKFITAFILLTKNNSDVDIEPEKIDASLNIKESKHKIKSITLKKILMNLIIAWIFFALAYSVVPSINKFLQSTFKNSTMLSFLPLAGWTVAAMSVAHVSAALALAGGSLASGELSTTQAIFALILGSGMGTVTRILRMNAGYYFGFFNVKTANKMLILNILIIIPFMLFNLILSFAALYL